MKKILICLVGLLGALPYLAAQLPQLSLPVYVGGFTRPVDIAHAGDARLFVVEQRGIIRIINAEGQILPQPFLDIDARVNSAANERGLLGLVFHPNYANNGYFYVNYTNNSGHTTIARFTVNPANPNLADPNSELILLTINQPFSNHNAGDLAFGPDGYLYVGTGDGGSGGDPQNFSQTRSSLLGKMLRLDVDGGSPYAIPPTNPFVSDPNTRDEIWAIGLRNPWRFSFDRLTGDMWIGDVGQDNWEEIDFQRATSGGGENYGWRCYEGNSAFNTNGCGPADTYVPPVQVYANNFSTGCSVTGGFVYRGERYPFLYGKYLYTDFCSGRIWALWPDGAGGWTNQQILQGSTQDYVSFGEDYLGEMYMAGLGSGNIFRVTTTCTGFALNAEITPETCDSTLNGIIELDVTGATPPYTYQWSNDQDDGNIIVYLTAGDYSVTVTDSLGCRLIETYTVPNSQPEPPTVMVTGAELQGPIGFDTYQWLLNGEPIDGANAATYIATVNGSYSLRVSTTEGCVATSAPVDVEVVGIPEALRLTGVTVSPNPFGDELRISLQTNQPGQYQWQLLSLDGRKLREGNWQVEQNLQTSIPTTSLPAGSYLLRMTRDGKEYSWRVQKG